MIEVLIGFKNGKMLGRMASQKNSTVSCGAMSSDLREVYGEVRRKKQLVVDMEKTEIIMVFKMSNTEVVNK